MGKAGIPASGVGAVLLDIAASSATASQTWAKVYTAGAAMPVQSVLRFGSDDVPRSSTAAVVPNSDGQISITVGGGTSDINVDVQGYFKTAQASGGAAGGFVPVQMAVAYDSTNPATADVALAPNGQVTLSLAGTGEVPSTASAVFANLGVRNVQSDGALKVVPAGQDPSAAKSIMNFSNGGPEDTGVAISLSAAGAVTILNTATTAVDLVVTVEGYFSTDVSTAGGFNPLAQPGVLNTTVTGQPLGAGESRQITIGGDHGIPEYGAGGVMLGVTVQGYTTTGQLEVYSTGDSVPDTGAVGFSSAEQGSPNTTTVVVQPGNFGRVSITNDSAGPLDVKVDEYGWFVGARAVDPSLETLFRAAAADVGESQDQIEQGIYVGFVNEGIVQDMLYADSVNQASQNVIDYLNAAGLSGQAADFADRPVPYTSDSGSFTFAADGSVVPSASSGAPDPAGCVLHPSVIHFRGDGLGVGAKPYTVCSITVADRIHHDSKLYKARWLGLSWQQMQERTQNAYYVMKMTLKSMEWYCQNWNKSDFIQTTSGYTIEYGVTYYSSVATDRVTKSCGD